MFVVYILFEVLYGGTSNQGVQTDGCSSHYYSWAGDEIRRGLRRQGISDGSDQRRNKVRGAAADFDSTSRFLLAFLLCIELGLRWIVFVGGACIAFCQLWNCPFRSWTVSCFFLLCEEALWRKNSWGSSCKVQLQKYHEGWMGCCHSLECKPVLGKVLRCYSSDQER